MSSLWLRGRRGNVTSQNGEDGVLNAIFAKLGLTKGWACEFGAADGVEFSNTNSLITRDGWHGVMIEKDNHLFLELCKNLAGPMKSGKLQAFCRELSADPGTATDPNTDLLEFILDKTDIPYDFDVLSIDVDGIDIEIWRSLERYKPIVVIIEVNSLLQPGVRKEVETSGGLGCSITAAVELAKAKGYELALHTGNAIFVRREYAAALDIDPDNWQELFDDRWIRERHAAECAP